MLQKQQSNPYFLYRDKHDWPVFFDQKDFWTLISVYESSDCFWFIDLRTKSKNPQLYFFDAEALYEGSVNPISNDIDKENTSDLLLSHMIVTEFLEHASEKEKMYSIAYQALKMKIFKTSLLIFLS